MKKGLSCVQPLSLCTDRSGPHTHRPFYAARAARLLLAAAAKGASQHGPSFCTAARALSSPCICALFVGVCLPLLAAHSRFQPRFLPTCGGLLGEVVEEPVENSRPRPGSACLAHARCCLRQGGSPPHLRLCSPPLGVAAALRLGCLPHEPPPERALPDLPAGVPSIALAVFGAAPVGGRSKVRRATLSHDIARRSRPRAEKPRAPLPGLLVETRSV